jgi:hypothetical protein
VRVYVIALIGTPRIISVVIVYLYGDDGHSTGGLAVKGQLESYKRSKKE